MHLQELLEIILDQKELLQINLTKMKAISKNIGISSKKLKPYIDLVRDKNINEALVLLKYQKSPAAFEIHKTIESAVANAKDLLIPGIENLKINEIYANQGTTLKRWRAAARGRPGTFNHPTSHIVVKLSEWGYKIWDKKFIQ